MKEELNKITYILGAGASANALPTVKPTPFNPGYTQSLRDLAQSLRIDSTISPSYLEFVTEFCDNLNWLAEKGDEYDTVDTFAKFCYHTDPQSLERLKFTLSLYFTIKQFVEKKTDKRYLNFITKCLDSRKLFPDNIKIINWNYDCQIQIAAESFRAESFTIHPGVTQQTPPLINYYPSLGAELNVNARLEHNEMSLVHLNGISGFYYYEQTTYILNYFLNQGIRDINNLFDKVLNDREHKHPLLTFSFESSSFGINTTIRSRIPLAKKLVENTDYLVIIGYSFPVDNILTDQEIFGSLKSLYLKGIYFQDPVRSGEFLRDIFDISPGVFIRDIKDTSSFYIPVESRLKRKEAYNLLKSN